MRERELSELETAAAFDTFLRDAPTEVRTAVRSTSSPWRTRPGRARTWWPSLVPRADRSPVLRLAWLARGRDDEHDADPDAHARASRRGDGCRAPVARASPSATARGPKHKAHALRERETCRGVAQRGCRALAAAGGLSGRVDGPKRGRPSDQGTDHCAMPARTQAPGTTARQPPSNAPIGSVCSALMGRVASIGLASPAGDRRCMTAARSVEHVRW